MRSSGPGSGDHLHAHPHTREVRLLLSGLVLCVAFAVGCGGDGSSSPTAGSSSDDAKAGTGAAGTNREAGVTRTADLAAVAIAADIGGDEIHSSGVVIDADAGLVLTSAHTTWGARSLKLGTNVGVLHGRIVARDPCGDLAIVQTQPRLPGLVALPLTSATPTALVTSSGRRWDPSEDSRQDTLVTIPVRVREGSGEAAGSGLRITAAVPLAGALVPESSGGPLVDAKGRFVGMAVVDRGGTAVTLPGEVIADRLDKLDAGRNTVYVGWRDYYRCAGRMHALTAARHAGFKPVDAQLNAPVTATRLTPTEDGS
jgi:S1-C subfamily serine protease